MEKEEIHLNDGIGLNLDFSNPQKKKKKKKPNLKKKQRKKKKKRETVCVSIAYMFQVCSVPSNLSLIHIHITSFSLTHSFIHLHSLVGNQKKLQVAITLQA